MSVKKLSINIVTWNSLTYIPFCLKSIFEQSFRNFQILVIDNGSSDGTLEFIEKNYPEVKILRNMRNLGYSRAHNQGIKLSRSEYILIMNPDVILNEDYLEKLIKEADENKNFTAFTGKILKFHFGQGELKEINFTDIIDTVGLGVFRSRNFVNLGENEKDTGQYNKKREIFGVSGGLLLLRKKYLDLLKVNREYFDESFFVYKEDVDLAWRMNIFGLKSLYCPDAIAYHHRQADQPKEKSLKSIRKARRKKSLIINYYSTRNHLLMIIKNDFLSNYLKDFFFITVREAKKFFYILFFETSTLKAYFDFLRNINKMRRKRHYILENKKSSRNFRLWLEKKN